MSEKEAPGWATNELTLRKTVGEWVEEAMRRQELVPWHGITDEGTFTESWGGYYLLTGDRKILEFMYKLRDGFLEWGDRTGALYHGYYAEGDAHHQPETWIFFLGHLWWLEKNRRNVEVLEDAAHHIGNWVKDVPEWYDWENHCFRGGYPAIGTRVVREYPPYNYEAPTFFRFIQMALNAYLATGKRRYLRFSRDYADKWCDLILKPGLPPSNLYPAGYSMEERTKLYAATSHRRVEEGDLSHYGSGHVPDVLIDLYALTKEKRYLEAAMKLLELFRDDTDVPNVCPYCAWTLAKSRKLTGDTSYDEAAIKKVSPLMEKPLPTILLYEGPAARRGMKYAYRNPSGVIEECKVPAWYWWGATQNLVLAYQISGDLRFLNRAMTLTERTLRLAKPWLRDGREHGCEGQLLHHAAGHAAAYILSSASMGLYRFCGGDVTEVRYLDEEGKPGLPEGVAALLEPTDGGRVVRLYNGHEEDVCVKIQVCNTDLKIKKVKVDGTLSRDFSGQVTTVTVKAGRTLKVSIDLA
jgi:hypothetical protein